MGGEGGMEWGGGEGGMEWGGGEGGMEWRGVWEKVSVEWNGRNMGSGSEMESTPHTTHIAHCTYQKQVPYRIDTI